MQTTTTFDTSERHIYLAAKILDSNGIRGRVDPIAHHRLPTMPTVFTLPSPSFKLHRSVLPHLATLIGLHLVALNRFLVMITSGPPLSVMDLVSAPTMGTENRFSLRPLDGVVE